MLYKLSDTVFINPEDVLSVEMISDRWIDVRMRSGEKYGVNADYGKSLWATQDRLVKEINEVCAKCP